MKKKNETEALVKSVSPKNRNAFLNWLNSFKEKFNTFSETGTNNCSFDFRGTRTRYIEIEPADGQSTSFRYEGLLNDLKDSAEAYIKNPKIQNNFVDCLLLKTYFFLSLGYFRQTYGYRIEYPVSGWRANMFVHITKIDMDNPIPFIWAFFSSGFFIYPLILYLTGGAYTWVNIIVGILLGLKILETAFSFLSFIYRSIKGKKRPILQIMQVYSSIYDYLLMNNIVQPIKIKENIQKLDGIIEPPTFVNVIIDRMVKKDPNYFETMCDTIRAEHDLSVKPYQDSDDAVLFGYPLKKLKTFTSEINNND